MKIIVNNEAEKDLVKKLLKTMRDYDILNDFREYENSAAAVFTDGEISFLEEALDSRILVDGKERQLYAEHDIVTGICSVCGTVTEGIEDREDIGYSEYLEITSEESQKKWLCEECTMKASEGGE